MYNSKKENSYIPKRTQVTNVGEDVEKRKPSYIVGGNVNCSATVENSMDVSQKTKNRTNNMTQQFHSWVYIQKNQKH